MAAVFLLAGLLFALPVPILKHAPLPEYFVYVGSKSKQGIYLYKFNATTPALTAVGVAPVADLPGIVALAMHPEGRFLYAVTSGSTLSAFAIHAGTGALRLLNAANSVQKDACSLAVEKKGWMLMVSYCGTVNVESFRTTGDGGVGASTGVTGVRARKVAISPDNFFLLMPDGEKVSQYRFDPARGIFWQNDPASAAMKKGGVASTVVFRPDEKFVYVADEPGSAVSTFTYDRDKGTSKLLSSLSIPGKPAAVEIDPAGKFLYVAHEGDISVLSTDRKKGTPALVGSVKAGDKAVTQLRIDPSGRYLFVQSDRISVFQISPKTGLLTPSALAIDLPDPTCFQFVPIPPESVH